VRRSRGNTNLDSVLFFGSINNFLRKCAWWYSFKLGRLGVRADEGIPVSTRLVYLMRALEAIHIKFSAEFLKETMRVTEDLTNSKRGYCFQKKINNNIICDFH